LRCKGHGKRKILAVLRHRDDVQVHTPPALEAVERSKLQSFADLSQPIRSEVEHNQTVAVFQAPAVGIADHAGLHEFIAGVLGIGRQDRVDRRTKPLAQPVEQEFVRPLGTIPTLVTVHGPIAPDDRRDPSDPSLLDRMFQGAQEFDARTRRGVAAIGDRVDQDPFGRQPYLGGHLEQSHDVLVGSVHASVRNQPHQVQLFPFSQGALHAFAQGAVGGKGTVLDGLVDTADVLVDHPPRPQVHVPHFAVAHDPQWQADFLAASREQAMRVARLQFVEVRRTFEHGIARGVLTLSPTIQDNEQQGRDFHGFEMADLGWRVAGRPA